MPFATTTGALLPSDTFNPASAVVVPSRHQIHLFGSGFIHGESETWQASVSSDFVIDRIEDTVSGGWSWTAVPNPPGVNRVAVGPGSAVLRAGVPVVFYATNAADAGNGEQFSDGVRSVRLEAQWNGMDHGSPDASNLINGAPLALTWNDGSSDHINLFVAAFNRADRRFHLYQRSLTACGDFSCWDAWSDFGAPPSIGGQKFRMTTASVWHAADGSLRIDQASVIRHLLNVSHIRQTGRQFAVYERIRSVRCRLKCSSKPVVKHVVCVASVSVSHHPLLQYIQPITSCLESLSLRYRLRGG